MTTVEGYGARVEQPGTEVEGSEAKVGIQQGTGNEVGREGPGAGSDRQVK